MGEVLTVLDIGTTKISVFISKFDNRSFESIFFKSFPSSGIKRGRIVDMESLTSSIKRAIQDTEDILKMKIRRSFVCSSGNEIQGLYSDAAVKIRKKEITEEDINLAIESATAMQIPSDRQAVHILPYEFVVDGIDGIRDPIGMKGLRLEARVYIITASSSHIQNLITCCNKAGIEVEEVVLHGVASAEAVVSEHDKDMGTMVVDIGGGSSRIAVFHDGYLRHLSNYGIGGNHITNDLALGLKIPFKEAERIKTQFGVALPDVNFGSLSFREKDREIEVIGMDKIPVKIPMSVIKEIIYARCEEILELIKKEISTVSESISVSSLVITGGTSQMRGFIQLAESFLSMPVRIGKPDLGLMTLMAEMGIRDEYVIIDEQLHECLTPQFSSTIGTLIYAIRAGSFQQQNSGIGGIWSRFASWIKEIMRI